MKTIGMARLGKEAEMRYLNDGTPILNLALAVNYGKAGQDGNRPTQWIDAAMFGARAEKISPFMLKGTAHCFTLSDLHIETFAKRDGGEGHKLTARIDDVELGPRQTGAAQSASAPAPRQAPPQRAPAPRAAPASSGFDDMADDVPFISCDWALEVETSKAKRMRNYDY